MCVWNFSLEEERVMGGTLNVKFGIYMCQMTIFRGGWGALDKCSAYILCNFLI
jgi:hypothetical protein